MSLLHQPYHVFTVDDVYVGFFVKGSQPLRLAPQNGGEAEAVKLVPLPGLILPCSLGHCLWRHNQDAPDFEAVVHFLQDGGQGNGCLPKASTHAQKYTGTWIFYNVSDHCFLVRM